MIYQYTALKCNNLLNADECAGRLNFQMILNVNSSSNFIFFSIMKSIPGSVELPPAHPPKPPLADYTTSTTGAKGHQPPTEVPSGDSATPLKPHQLPSSAGSAHGLNIHSLSEITSLHPDKPLPRYMLLL